MKNTMLNMAGLRPRRRGQTPACGTPVVAAEGRVASSVLNVVSGERTSLHRRRRAVVRCGTASTCTTHGWWLRRGSRPRHTFLQQWARASRLNGWAAIVAGCSLLLTTITEFW
jgi:hypothetical protein